MAMAEWVGRRRVHLVVLLAAALVLLGLSGLAVASSGEDDPPQEATTRTTPEPEGIEMTEPTPDEAAGPATTPTTASPTTGAAPANPAAPPGEATGGPATGHWRPAKGLSWQWQLDGQAIDTSVDADVYDVDLFETPPETVRRLHDQGRKVICYFSAGSWEPYRPDAGDYPESVKGGAVDGWPDERWLDIRQLDVLRPLIAARLDLCVAKGADGAEPDWMDSYVQDTGWDITAADQLAFNRMIADLAHERGLAIGLKNDLDQVAELADVFDFAVVEQCAEYGECEKLLPFLDRNKAVFHAEYDLPTSAFCAESRRLGISSIRKRLELDPWRETC
jgi:hypothetical protein